MNDSSKAHRPVTVISSHRPGMGFFLNPLAMARNLWGLRGLCGRLVRRQLALKYRGSVLGLLWSLVHPLAVLAVYTFVFSVVFSVRWGKGEGGSHGEFALALFAGLIAFNVFSETLQNAPHTVSVNRTYIKKMVFPLEAVPLANLGVALFQSLCSVLILLGAVWIMHGKIPASAWLLPVLYLPLVLLCMGLGWLLAALGGFVKDAGHAMQIMTLALFFLTPVFYPLEAAPEKYQGLLSLNPMCFIVEGFRGVLVFGRPPSLSGCLLATAACLCICLGGYAWFMKHKGRFADIA